MNRKYIFQGVCCFLGLHKWSGCKCSICGKNRDAAHAWSKDCEYCFRCGKRRNNEHDWTKDCEVCAKCGSHRDNAHDWSKDCNECAKCGKSRTDGHDFKYDCTKCKKCGKPGTYIEHEWAKDCEVCARCRTHRDNAHDWSKDCNKCAKCGKSRTDAHDFRSDCTKCEKCGKPSCYAEHDWTKDCETCARCSTFRSDVHVWRNGKCLHCSQTARSLLATAVAAVDYNCHIAKNAAKALGKCKDISIVPDLVKAMIDQAHRGGFLAHDLAKTLGKLCNGKAPSELLSILDRHKEWPWSFGIVAVALKEIGDQSVVPALIKALQVVEESHPNCYNKISDTLNSFGHSSGGFCFDKVAVYSYDELLYYNYKKRKRKRGEVDSMAGWQPEESY